MQSHEQKARLVTGAPMLTTGHNYHGLGASAQHQASTEYSVPEVANSTENNGNGDLYGAVVRYTRYL